jgi:hypothetical protein
MKETNSGSLNSRKYKLQGFKSLPNEKKTQTQTDHAFEMWLLFVSFYYLRN